MIFLDATEALLQSSRVVCSEARDAVTRSIVTRERVRATVRASQCLRATALILRGEVLLLPGLQKL